MELKNKNLQKIYTSLEKDKETLSSEELKKKYLSKEGLLTKAFSEISKIAQKERALYGQEANKLKSYINELIESKTNFTNAYSSKERIDPTAPFDINTKIEDRPQFLDTKGTQHPLTKDIETFVDIFKGMGFDVLESRQLDDDYHMFESLNFPVGHPARDMYDTFWTEDGLVLPAHTSTMQNRAMKMFGPPPIAVVLPGRCFRNEATDASHEHTFHQIEGIYVDENVSLGNMIATIKEFLQRYLETDLEVRIQPSFFPFTEPDCEFVISCPFCKKVGCSTCGNSGWIELMGCGMIHPNVLRQADIDPNKYSGFAWGFGVDRLTMIKMGINDIRYLRDSNLNFLRQF
ncbi:MAG: phenylalanine--tRNA ligase subunit alpha [Candidatus Dojkabacteria bacterium]|jgi:phenylalanyl-tRNA synthetase alpha chain